MAEHSWAVAVLAMELAKRLGMTTEEVAQEAVVHDQEEVITGDIPTPLKKKIIGAGVGHIIHCEDREVDMVSAVVKIADTMEAIIYISKWGNSLQAKTIQNEMHQRLDEELAEAPAMRKHVWDILNEAMYD